ncbi:MAG: hypothetical protein IJ856_06145 [Candidatus Methanomethylophilaceae archaeon]|nr:hypothetical protein [Candidatus Methanomethylophilaceae archaeon]
MINLINIAGTMRKCHFTESTDYSIGTIFLMDEKPVSRSDLSFKPMPGMTWNYEMEREFTEDEMWNLGWGHKSRSIYEKWDTFMEDGKLYICMSPAGNCIYIVSFGENGKHEVTVNGERTSSFSVSRRYDIETVEAVINQLLRPVRVPASLVPEDVTGNLSLMSDEEMQKDTKFEWTAGDFGRGFEIRRLRKEE